MNQNEESLKWFNKYINSNPNGRYASMASRNINELKARIEKQPDNTEQPQAGGEKDIPPAAPVPDNTDRKTDKGLINTPAESSNKKSDGSPESGAGSTPDDKSTSPVLEQ
jgi:hypothetical protein